MKKKNVGNNVYPIKNVCEMKNKKTKEDILEGIVAGGLLFSLSLVLVTGGALFYAGGKLIYSQYQADRIQKLAEEQLENGKILIDMNTGSYLFVDVNSKIKMNENGKIEFIDNLDYGENYETIKDYIIENNLCLEEICNLDAINYDGTINQVDMRTFIKDDTYFPVFYIGDLEYTIEEYDIQVLRLKQ